MQSVLNVIKNYPVHGMVHNTGGGFIDNIPRVLPKSCAAKIDCSSWTVPPVFQYIQNRGEIPQDEMYKVFNMGIGLLVIVDDDQLSDITLRFEAMGEEVFLIGKSYHGKKEPLRWNF